MLRPRVLLRSLNSSGVCFFCQRRALRLSSQRHAALQPSDQQAPSSAEKPAASTSTTSKEDEEDKHIPQPLRQLLGLPNPPQPGENTGIDPRTLRQRRNDFVNYDKHLERRKELTKKISRPYYRDWKNMRYSKGKTFVSPNALFRADKALYFPNLYGQTLASSSFSDTTPVLRKKVSVVACFSSTWAEKQVKTFVSKSENPELHDLVKESGGVTQLVSVNVEENTLRYWIVRLFMPLLRRKVDRERQGKYFLVRRGLTDEIKNAIGILNSQVGYVYLLDGECRIRWAGSGDASEGERRSMVKALGKLVDEWRNEGIGQRGRGEATSKEIKAVA